MCASFNWQRENDEGGESWEHDGSSKWRTVRPQEAPRGFWTRGRITGMALAGILLIGLGAGSLIRIEDTVRATGVVEPLEGRPIKATIKAVVEKLLCREGDLVDEGEVLVKLWPQESSVVANLQERRQEMEQETIEVEKTTKRIEILDAEREKFIEERRLIEADLSPVENAREMVKLARIDQEQKRKDHDRIRELERQGVASKEELEKAQAALEIAEAERGAAASELRSVESSRRRNLERLARDVQIVEKRLGLARLELKESEKELERFQERLKTAQERLSHTTILAPFSGRVVKREKRPGDRVEPGDFILMLAASDSVRLRAELDPKDAHYVKRMQKAHVYSRFYPFHKYGAAKGHVTDVYTYARPHTGATAREAIPAYVTVDESPFPLPLGTTADVYIVVGKRPILFHRRPLKRIAATQEAEESTE